MSATPAPAAVRMRRAAAAVIRELCVAPVWESGTEWAARYRVLPETSTAPGKFDPSVVPYARRWLDLLVDPAVSMVALCWASQMIKSTVLENAIGYRIHRMPAPIIVVTPKIDSAESWSKERFIPMVKATPVLRDRVRLGRSSGSTLRYLRFPGGFVAVASAQSASELAARSSSFVLCDEVDRFEIIPGEGNPVEIVARRQAAAEIGLLAVTSTPRDAETTIIWPYLEGGTFEFYHLPCPHCGFPQRLEWERLRWEKREPATAHYVCADCGAVIEESDKPAMLAAGEWIPSNPDAPYPSSHLNGLYSPFAKSSWASLATEWERAQGKRADLQVFINTRLAELWQETSEVLDSAQLLQRLEPIAEGAVPLGVGLLTAGVDVQHNRLECYVWGWGAGLESWLVAAAIFPGDPQHEPDTPGSVWSALDAFLAQRFPHDAGGDVPITAVGHDTGYATSQAYRFTRSRRIRRVYALKGVGGMGVPLIAKPTLQGKERNVLYSVGTDTAKTEFLRSQLEEPQRGPGFVHLPDWLTSDQCEQFVAEKRGRRVHRGRVIYEWRPKSESRPNEALDCRVYARAALEILGSQVIAQLGAKAEELQQRGARAQEAAARADAGEAPDPAEDEAEASGRTRRESKFWRGRGGWMDRMR